MPIPQSQLVTWSNPGATTTSSAAYASIKHALEKASSPLANRGVEIFLQGSYRNATNIYGDSDVDVVVYHPTTYVRDVSALTETQRALEAAAFVPATYQWSHLHDEALAALRSHYGSSAVTPGSKSIKIQTGSGRLASDVVPAIHFRRYATFVNANNYTSYEGIQLYDASGNAIINYPKLHIERGEAKNKDSRTGGFYKPTVRIFKNLRNALVDKGRLTKGVAPSYFIECALHNVPDDTFIGPFDETVPAILEHLVTVPFANLWCQNGVVRLIGSGSTEWSKENFAAFVQAGRTAWQSW